MAIITEQEQGLLRSQTKQTKLYLSIYQPDTILSARVNDATIAKGEREVTYDGASGDWTDIVAGMSLMVGSSAGLDDKGRIRVKSATSTVLTVAENSHINWSDDDFLTVVNFFEINAVYPRIIQDPADELQLIFYKDYDVEYSDQNSALGSFVKMGSHYAGFLDGGSHDVYYSASGTYDMRQGTLNYEWSFEGGSPSTFSGRDPGLVTYSSAGQYKTSLTVSGSFGAVDHSYRHVSIYDRPEDGTNNPILNWSLENLSGDRNKGGYVGKIKIYQDIDDTVLRDGSLIVIFSEDWFDGTKQSIGGNSENRDNIFFVGYVVEGSITYNYRESVVEFEIGSPTEIMKQAEGFSISVSSGLNPGEEATTNPDIPSGWVVLRNMNIRRALFHYLRWQSTVLNCIDVEFIGNDKLIQYFDSDRTSLFDAVSTLMKGTLLGSAVCDRQGTLYCETPLWSSVEASNFATTMEITSQDWMDEPSFTEIMVPPTSFIELGGIQYSGATTGTFGAYLSSIPGEAPGYRGAVERRQGLALASQAQLNTLGGDYFSYLNARYPDLSFSMPGAYRNFDIAPQEVVPFSLSPEENVRGLTFTRKSFFPISLGYSYLPSQEFVIGSMILYELTSGFLGDTITIPDVPPTGGGDDVGGGFNLPPFNIPPLPNYTPTVLGVLSQQVITPDWVYDTSAPTTGLDFNTTNDGWLFADGAQTEAEGTFTVPLGANHCIVSFIFRLVNGGTGANAYLTRSFAAFTPSATPVLNTAGTNDDGAVAIGASPSSGYKTTVGAYTLDHGVHYNQGDIIQWIVGRDATADPPDTYASDLYFVGILVQFFL